MKLTRLALTIISTAMLAAYSAPSQAQNATAPVYNQYQIQVLQDQANLNVRMKGLLQRTQSGEAALWFDGTFPINYPFNVVVQKYYSTVFDPTLVEYLRRPSIDWSTFEDPSPRR